MKEGVFLNTIEQIREMFSNDIFATETTGIVINEVNDGFATCSLKIERRHMNAANSVMGGAIYTLADFTFAVASNFNRPLTVTLSSNINFLASPKGDTLICKSQLINETLKTTVHSVTITDNTDRLIATVTCTGYKKVQK